MTFQARLRSILERGNLTVADLARWLNRPHATVSTWVKNGRQPTGTAWDLKHLEARLRDLEQRIIRKAGFPVPSGPQRWRLFYLARLGKARHVDSRHAEQDRREP